MDNNNYSYINSKLTSKNVTINDKHKLSFEDSSNKANEPSYKFFPSNENIKNALNITLKDDLDIDLKKYLITDFDDMDYDDAIKKDKRKFCEYFSDKLKAKQILLNTFFIKEQFKPRTIKILLLILDIDLYLFVNALFINEEYVSQIFNLTEKDNFFSFIPRSINRFLYTTLVGVILNYIIDCFFIEEKKIKGIFKREKENDIILKFEITQIIRNISKRYCYFIIISFIITIFTWYYIFCFNNIYPHMKIEWIKSTFAIIIIMEILSILICLLESIIRFFSFKCKSEKIYKISLFLS